MEDNKYYKEMKEFAENCTKKSERTFFARLYDVINNGELIDTEKIKEILGMFFERAHTNRRRYLVFGGFRRKISFFERRYNDYQEAKLSLPDLKLCDFIISKTDKIKSPKTRSSILGCESFRNIVAWLKENEKGTDESQDKNDETYKAANRSDNFFDL